MAIEAKRRKRLLDRANEMLVDIDKTLDRVIDRLKSEQELPDEPTWPGRDPSSHTVPDGR